MKVLDRVVLVLSRVSGHDGQVTDTVLPHQLHAFSHTRRHRDCYHLGQRVTTRSPTTEVFVVSVASALTKSRSERMPTREPSEADFTQ